MLPFPGLYDPMTASDVYPLLNIFETAVTTSPSAMVDACRLEMGQDSESAKLLAVLDNISATMHGTRGPSAWRSTSFPGRCSTMCTPATRWAVRPHWSGRTKTARVLSTGRMFDGLISHLGPVDGNQTQARGSQLGA